MNAVVTTNSYFGRLMIHVGDFWDAIFGNGPAAESGRAFSAAVLIAIFMLALPILVLICVINSFIRTKL